MDIFKQKQYLGFSVIILVFLNLTTLTLLWIGRPELKAPHREPRNPIEQQNRVQRLLKKELGFDQIQTEYYLKLRREHREKMQQLSGEIRQLKRQMFDEVLQDNPQPFLSDSLLRLAQDKQAIIEQLTFQHFLDLKKLCKPQQQGKLKLLMKEMFHQNPPRGMKSDGPPPPPGAELPPRPPGAK